MIKHADRIDRIELSGIRKINETALQMEREGAKIIHFEIGRPDFDTPQYIKDEAIRSLQAGDVCYTSNLGKDALRTAVAEYLNRFFVKCWGDPLIHLVEEHFIGVFLFFFGLLSIHK